MKTLWAKILAFLGKIFGATIAPPEVAGADQNIENWWAIYRARAPWLPFEFVTSDGKKRKRNRFTLNMAKVLCSEMAGLVLSEVPEVSVSPLVQDVIEREALWDNLRKTTEYQGALGGQVIKVGIEKGLVGPEGQPLTSDKITLDFVKPQNFIPLSWDNSTITEGTFVDRRVVKGKSVIRVETHRRNAARNGYTITNKAFDEESGQERSLEDFGGGIEPEVQVAIPMPLFAYIRNPEANNIEPESPTGISLYANAIDTLQALDLAFDGLKTEIILGRQRIALPGTVMRGYIDKDGTQRLGFDPTDEAYIRLEGDDASAMKPSDLSGQLRLSEYKAGIQTLLDILAVQTGFSAGYFSFDGTSVKTATEVISDNSKTYKTMQAFRENLDAGLKHIFSVIDALGIVYAIEGFSMQPANIAWNDGVIEDRNSRSTYWTALYQAKLTDRRTAIKAIHGLDDAAAAEMDEKITDESKTVGADAVFNFGS